MEQLLIGIIIGIPAGFLALLLVGLCKAASKKLPFVQMELDTDRWDAAKKWDKEEI